SGPYLVWSKKGGEMAESRAPRLPKPNPPHGFVVDVDTTDEFLDYPDLVYRMEDGSLRPLFTPEEIEKLGTLYPDSRLKIPPPPPPDPKKRTFQVKLDGMGAALYDAADAEAALRDFFANFNRDGQD